MSYEVAPLAECLLALIAGEWFLTCVGSGMPFQLAESEAYFPANITLKASSALSVRTPQMKLEGGFCGEVIATELTRMDFPGRGL